MASLQFPQDYLQMNDIYLWSTTLEREAEYQPDIHRNKTTIQSRQSVEVELLDAVADDDNSPAKLLRALVTLGIRIMFADGDGAEPQPLHTLEATFAAEYILLREIEEKQYKEFCDFNCVHNVWPFWRQHVYETLKKASLPVVAVPFFPGKPSGRKKARKKIATTSGGNATES